MKKNLFPLLATILSSMIGAQATEPPLLESTEEITACQQAKKAPAPVAGPREFEWGKGTRVLIMGGNKSHDFNRWFNRADAALLTEAGNSVHYTDRPADILPALKQIDVLYLSNNQAIPDPATRKAIFDFADRGKGLVMVHAALWYNWRNWPEYNKVLVGGGSRGHDRYGNFEVEVTKSAHPVMAGLPEKFEIKDELYKQNVDSKGTAIEVLAQATSPHSGTTYPSVWITKHPKARIVCITLGHDGASHTLPQFRTLLKNSIKWAAGK